MRDVKDIFSYFASYYALFSTELSQSVEKDTRDIVIGRFETPEKATEYLESLSVNKEISEKITGVYIIKVIKGKGAVCEIKETRKVFVSLIDAFD